jgi:hypothetical protein
MGTAFHDLEKGGRALFWVGFFLPQFIIARKSNNPISILSVNRRSDGSCYQILIGHILVANVMILQKFTGVRKGNHDKFGRGCPGDGFMM